MMENYDSLMDAIEGLRTQGYTVDFNLKENYLECLDGQYKVFHDDFTIDKYFRFEENTDPAEQSILYAVSSARYNLKGLLVNAYGVYSDSVTDEMARYLTFMIK